MDNVFIKYLSKKAKKEAAKVFEPGPVITISRQYGCYATNIARNLSDKLSEKSPNAWDYITKEILEEAAQKLDVSVHEIAHIFGADEKSFLSDIMVSFSTKNYKSDSVIKKTIQSVVNTYAEQGNCIIVGRAGCIISKDIQKAIHVRLIASSDYRTNTIKSRFNLSDKEAYNRVIETDKKRDMFMKFFKGDLPDDKIFDLVLNREKLSDAEIIGTIENLAEIRGLV